MIEDLSNLPRSGVLILDDYHSIEAQQIHDIVASMVEYLPQQMRLVLATRIDPPLPLARLRACNQMMELRVGDLSFSHNETTVFFNQVMNLALSSEAIDVFENLTEGWVAGLQLAALSLQSREDISSFVHSFAGDDRHIVDYLVEEVLNLQPPDIHEFLLQTSILNRLSESLCDQVMNIESSQKILDALERANLFIIPLDYRGHWYRYHHLFADLLRKQLQQTQGDCMPELHCRASHWYEKNNLNDEALEHTLSAGDFERAAHLLGGFAKRAWEFGGNTRMLQWYKKIPDEFIHKDPELCFFNACMLFENGHYNASEENLQIVESLIGSVSDSADNKGLRDEAPKLESAQLHGKVAVIRAYTASFRKKVDDIIRFSKIALEYLPETSTSWRATTAVTLGDAYFYTGDFAAAGQQYREAARTGQETGNYFLFLAANLGRIKIKRLQGDLSGAIDIFNGLLDTAQTKGVSQTPMMGWVHTRWGEILIELNQLEDAAHHIRKGLELSEAGNDASMIGQSYINLAKLKFSSGDLAGVNGAIQKIDEIAANSDIPGFVSEPLEELRVRIWLKQGAVKTAMRWMKEHGLKKNDIYMVSMESRYVLFARIYHAQGRFEDALDVLQKPIEAARMGGRKTSTVEMLLIKVLVQSAQGKRSEAITTLKEALLLAETSGYVNIFFNEGPQICGLLEKILDEKSGIPRAYIKKLLSTFKLNRLIETEEGPVERLSDREMEVLRYVAAGLSSKKITEELFISMSTVKTHLRNIYSKLNVNNRTGAVARAKELDLF